MQPLISIIVLVYQVETWLPQCLDSLTQQTGDDIEIIVVDDGSPDGSAAICDAYAQRDARFRVLHLEHGGISLARKAGIATATGQYIGAVDGDDWLAPGAVARLRAVAAACQPDMLLFDYISYYRQASFRRRMDVVSPGLHANAAYDADVLRPLANRSIAGKQAVGNSLCLKWIRAPLLRAAAVALNPDIALGEDAFCTYYCVARARSLYYLAEPLYYYRQRPTSATHSADVDALRRLTALRRALQIAVIPSPVPIPFLPDKAYLQLLVASVFFLHDYAPELNRQDKQRIARNMVHHPATKQALWRISVRGLPAKRRLLYWVMRMRLVPPRWLGRRFSERGVLDAACKTT